MAIDSKNEAREVFVRDESLTRTGFNSYEEAQAVAAGLPQGDGRRIRVRLRRRTGKWDVVVKQRRSTQEKA